jgi:hypothetical protein
MDPNSITPVVEGMPAYSPIVQMIILAILPLIMQGLKTIAWVEKQKAWLCPLLCIAASMAAAYILKIPQWALVGILTGISCNKIYDWAKDAKKSVMTILFITALLLMPIFAGCELWASSKMKQTIQASAVNVGILAERCKAGDPNACKLGCIKGAETLDEISAALEGGRK